MTSTTLSFALSFGCLVVVGCASTSSDGGSSAEADITAPMSAYTSLSEADCQTLPSSGENEMPFTQQSCAGMPGWSLLVEDFDSRNNVQVKHGDLAMDLAVWNRLPAFSHLGPKAEWRGPAKAPGVVDPYALIFRFFQTDAEGHESSHLVVSRITATASCIVGQVDGGDASANQKARDMADAARGFVCPSADGPPPSPASVFTDMGKCPVTNHNDNEGWSESTCAGTGGYSLVVFNGDLRADVKVKTATGETGLELFRLGAGYSWVGPTADWRVHGSNRDPHALVFRRHEQLGENAPETSELVVVKLAGDLACIYDVIDTKKHPDANVLAHAAADAAYAKSCPAAPPAAH